MAEVYPKLSNNNYTAIPSAPSPPESTNGDKKRKLTPIMLRCYSLLKFAIFLSFVMTRSWPREYETLVFMVMVVDFSLLCGSISQDFCSLTIVIIFMTLAIALQFMLLIFLPVGLASFYACGAGDNYRFPSQLQISFVTEAVRLFSRDFRSQEELRFIRGVEYGLDAELLLFAFFYLTQIHLSLANKVLNDKFKSLAERRAAEKAKKNEITIYDA